MKHPLYLRSALLLALLSGIACAEEINLPDLPPPAQVESALNQHLTVLNATNELRMEHANQRKWNSGNYEFSLRAGTGQRNIAATGQNLKEWDVALERPLRLLNKAGIDEDIGAASVARAEYALGDARHEAGRTLLRLWFAWQREQAQVALWQQQVDILKQQAQMTEKRIKAGDAPKLELNQTQAAAAQVSVSWNQAQLRAQLAGNDLTRQFPAIQLPGKLPYASDTLLIKPLAIRLGEQTTLAESLVMAEPADCERRRGDGIPASDACAHRVIPSAIPQAVEHDFTFWKSRILEHNHELGMAQEQSRVQQLLAQRSRADQLPDPTVGVRYASESGGNEKVSGVYLSVPFSFGQRSATTEGAAQQAAIAANQEAFVKRRLEGDIYAAYTQAVSSFSTWQQAHEAAQAIRNNAELVGKAYSLGESSLSDSLTARRFALESSLAENLAQLDANEARYRLLLDAHQLWPLGNGHLYKLPFKFTEAVSPLAW